MKQTIYRFQFYVNDIYSEIFEYDLDDYIDLEDLMNSMENDKTDFIFENMVSGYIEIK